MDESYRQKRHTQLWEEQNKLIKRTVVAGLVFAAFILFNVLQPFIEKQKDSTDLEQKIETLKEDKAQAEASLKRVAQLEQELAAIHADIQREPWVTHKDELIRAYSEMRQRNEGNPGTYQELADATIRLIDSDVRGITDRAVTL